MFKAVEFILYVSNQNSSKEFYERVLLLSPTLHVPRMTEFALAQHCKLGLMPASGIAQIITPAAPHPNLAAGVPRCEVYLKVTDAQPYLTRALQAGATLVSELQSRNWGDKAGYVMDADGHILAFAE